MNDLISRQAAIALADTLKDDVPDDERIADAVMARNEGILEYQTKLSLLPSAQPDIARDIATIIGNEKDMRVILSGAERPRGKWNTYYHGDIGFAYSCNQCGYGAPYQILGGEVFQKKWNFCPNCGADMRGEQDGKTT